MTRNRITTYVHCDCGLLVRCGALHPDSEQAKGLASLNSHAFAGECPGCKTIAQVTLTPPSVVQPPSLTIIKKG